MKDFMEAMDAVGISVMTMNEGDTEPQAAIRKAATHTPERWFLDTCGDGSMIIQPREGFSICAVKPRDGFDNDIPNFRLMAAAPELLNACKMALDYISEYCPEIGGTLTMTMTAAIAKAEGGC